MPSKPTLRSLSATLASALAVIMVPGSASAQTSTAAPSSAAPAQKVIRGSIVYREKTALPADAELVVQLVDETNPEFRNVVAETTIPTAGRQVPIPFTLSFDPAKATGKRHGLHASIRYGGRTRYVTATRVLINPASLPEMMTMVVVPGEAEPPPSDSPVPQTGPGKAPPSGMVPPRAPR